MSVFRALTGVEGPRRRAAASAGKRYRKYLIVPYTYTSVARRLQPAPTATKPGRKPRTGSRKSTSAYIYAFGKLRVCALHHDFCEHRVHKAQPSAARSAPFYLSSLLQAPARAQPREPAASCGSRGKKPKSSTDPCFADAETSPTAPDAETLLAAAGAAAGAGSGGG